MTSVRAEHVGSIAIILLVHILQQVLKADIQMKLWVGNPEVIRRMSEEEVKPLELDYDLYRATKEWSDRIEFSLEWC